MNMKKIVAGAVFAVTAGLVVANYAGAMGVKPYADGVVSDTGAIVLPDDFRTRYVMLGAWSVEGDADTDGLGLHVVYTQPSTVKAYKETGKFPDGAVLVKELFKGHTEDLTTGQATSAGDKAGTFILIKDTQGRFKDNALWGDGWGWAFFGGDETKAAATTDYQAECLGCHEPARDTDFIYDFAYPVLRK